MRSVSILALQWVACRIWEALGLNAIAPFVTNCLRRGPYLQQRKKRQWWMEWMTMPPLTFSISFMGIYLFILAWLVGWFGANIITGSFVPCSTLFCSALWLCSGIHDWLNTQVLFVKAHKWNQYQREWCTPNVLQSTAGRSSCRYRTFLSLFADRAFRCVLPSWRLDLY